MSVQNNVIIYAHNKVSLIVIYIMSIFVIKIFIKIWVFRVIFRVHIAPPFIWLPSSDKKKKEKDRKKHL